MQATLLNYGATQGYERCSVASQGSLEEDECDSSEELIGSASASGGGQPETQTQTVGAQPKLAPISGSVGSTTGSTTVFRLQFLGSVEVEEEGGRKRRKRLKKHMVEEAVTKIKVGLTQSSPKHFSFFSFFCFFYYFSNLSFFPDFALDNLSQI